MDTINTINNDLETIKQDYLKLIEQINKSNNDPVTNIKIDESVAVNATNMKAYRDSIGNYLKTFNDKRSTDLQKSKYDKKFIQVNYSSKKVDNLRLFGVYFVLNYGTALRMSFIKTNDFFRNITIRFVVLSKTHFTEFLISRK